MKKVSSVFVLVLALLLAASCTTFKLEGAQITREIPAYTSVGTFDVNVKVYEFLGSAAGTNLFNITATNMDTKIYDAIQREIQKYTGDAAVNVSIEYKASFGDLFLNGLTFSLVAPATAHLKGTIVKYNK